MAEIEKKWYVLSAVSSLVKEEDISLDELKQLIDEVERADKKD